MRNREGEVKSGEVGRVGSREVGSGEGGKVGNREGEVGSGEEG